ncbi:unnamed protein product [Soboliphyme baturini]|uniref:Peptidase S1 domain-containing protein n=1 Tax=Soboliphyme baturini TaxID=241478 RepID=A0A183ILY6_9BILA|nr:unnamed protein product [Soboliphyme baturini]
MSNAFIAFGLFSYWAAFGRVEAAAIPSSLSSEENDLTRDVNDLPALFERHCIGKVHFLKYPKNGNCEQLSTLTGEADEEQISAKDLEASTFIRNVSCPQGCVRLTFRFPDDSSALSDFSRQQFILQRMKATPPPKLSNIPNCMICGRQEVRPSVSSLSLDTWQKRNFRIIGGDTAEPHSWPWQASLLMKGHHICGASVISKNAALTAAHCFPSRYGDFTLAVERHSLYTGGRVLKIMKIIIHEGFDVISQRNDIALILFEESIEFNERLQPICLPTEEVEDRKPCVATGWGVVVPTIFRDVCNDQYHYWQMVDKSMICAGYEEGGRDTCQGDSGGPLSCLNKNGEYELHGITSWGEGCASPKKPGVYTNVHMFIKWIKDNLWSHQLLSLDNRLSSHYRIIGGFEARPNSWPWQIALLFINRQICGGVLVSNDYVVTAAHCIEYKNLPSLYKVLIGQHNLHSSKENVVKVDRIWKYPGYGRPMQTSNDIAVLKLKEKLTFNQKVNSVCLAERDVADNTQCVVSGWGRTDELCVNLLHSVLGNDGSRLQQTVVPIINSGICNDGQHYNGAIDDSMICAGYENGGKDACQGDSGGPLVCPADDGRWILCGIVSWGYGCARPQKPGVYSRVSKFSKWIMKIIKGNRKNLMTERLF